MPFASEFEEASESADEAEPKLDAPCAPTQPVTKVRAPAGVGDQFNAEPNFG
jgi:hypothetical protein